MKIQYSPEPVLLLYFPNLWHLPAWLIPISSIALISMSSDPTLLYSSQLSPLPTTIKTHAIKSSNL